MTGKPGNTASYTADELAAKRAAGEGRTDQDLSDEEALRRRRADPEAPEPCDGWQDTITTELPEPKEQVTLRLDAEVLRWFRAQGRGYQTRMNAVLKGYVKHQSQNHDRGA